MRAFAPTAIGTHGYVRSLNGWRFGWGFDPGQRVRIENPDTGHVHLETMNKHGWRDRDRAYDNADDSFRIVYVGDSAVFGFIVPGDRIAGRVLEDRLRATGINAEVISIGVSGWGTDQQLEALREEGMRYRPDVVVIHVSENDAGDNLMHRDTGKFGSRKPFFYELAADGSAVRHENPRFVEQERHIKRQYVIASSEILKRLWILRGASKRRESPLYRIGDNQAAQLRFLLGGSDGNRLLSALGAPSPNGIDASSISAAIAGLGLEPHQEAIMRIAENRHFHEHWHPPYYRQTYHDFQSERWRLLGALLVKAKRVAEAGGARLAIFADHEDGSYAWDRFWFRVATDDETRARYRSVATHLAGVAARSGIGFVDAVHPVTRARNDGHANIDGNAAVAANIHAYLIREHGAALAAHPLPQATSGGSQR